MPYLLNVSGERKKLEPNGAYVMGRSLDCDIVVEDMAASRQHARIITGLSSDAILLEDLKSRNGTYVNDERVDGRVPLLDRARIRIGATFFLLRGEDSLSATATDATRLDTHTMGLENMSLGTDVDPNVLRVASAKGRANTEIAGNLASFTMIDVLQLLVQTHRTGTLHIAAGGEHAQVHLQDGDVIHATLQTVEGIEALRALVKFRDGIFWLVEHMPRVRRTIREAGSVTVFELCRDLDESRTA